MFVSYSQNFEDVLLWRCFRDVECGFYIDVGAQDPVVDSVSRAFYENGWRGCHVEPTFQYAEMLRRDRPDELVFQLALGRENGVADFWTIEGTGLSTMDQAIADDHGKRGFVATRGVVPVITLDELFARLGRDEVHWLKIDVEGGEKSVLEGWKLSAIRPWVLVLESTRPMTTTEDYLEWEPFVLDKGYEFSKFDGLNRFYVHRAHLDLKNVLAPSPNVFDGFSLSGSSTHSFSALLKHRSDELEHQASEARRQVEQAIDRVGTLEHSLTAAGSRLEQVQACMHAAEGRAQSAESRAQSAEFRAQSAESRNQLAEARALMADARIHMADARILEADGRVKEADARILEADGRVKEAEVRILEQAERANEADFRALNAEVESIQAKQAARDAELRTRDAASKVQELEVRLAEAVNQQAASREELSLRAVEVTALEIRAGELLQHNREHWQRIEAQAAELQQRYADIEYWHGRVLLLHGSTSWRLTAPLRVIGRWLKREGIAQSSQSLAVSGKQMLKPFAVGAMSAVMKRPKLRRCLGRLARKVPGLHGHGLAFARKAGLLPGYVAAPLPVIQASSAPLVRNDVLQLPEADSASMSGTACFFYRELSQATLAARHGSE